MRFEHHKYARACWKEGVRIYPIAKYGGYYLEIEFNKTEEFLPRDVIKKKMGEKKYPSNTHEWSNKMGELYEHIYKTKVAPKLSAA
jgi:hypothetical protein